MRHHGFTKKGALRNLLTSSLAACLFSFATPSFAQAQPSDDPQELLRIIEEQQRQMDRQSRQLDEQSEQLAEHQRALQELRALVEQLQGAKPAAGDVASVPPPSAPGNVPDDEKGTPLKKPDQFQAASAAPKDEWPGFYSVPGTNTQFKVGGFIELDLLRDSDDVYTPGAMLTAAIATRPTGSQAAVDGQTNFSVQASRISIETRTPLKDSPITGPRRVTTFFSWDLFGDFLSTNPEFRLREAYGEVDDFMLSGGSLLVGQTWSTFTNLYAVPSPLEFQGPNALFGTRHGMVRWTKQMENGFKLKIAAEAPDLRSFDLEDFSPPVQSSDPSVDVTKESRWPDGVVSLFLERERYNLSTSFTARDLRASNSKEQTDSTFGWGVNAYGRVYMPGKLSKDFIQYAVTYGKGIGGLFNDIPPDAVYDVKTNQLQAIPVFATFITYTHHWSPEFSSLLTYGYLNQKNKDVQQPTAYHRTNYATANIVWTPDPRWLLGFELVYGSRKDKDGEKGSNIRAIMTSRFNF